MGFQGVSGRGSFKYVSMVSGAQGGREVLCGEVSGEF